MAGLIIKYMHCQDDPTFMGQEMNHGISSNYNTCGHKSTPIIDQTSFIGSIYRVAEDEPCIQSLHAVIIIRAHQLSI